MLPAHLVLLLATAAQDARPEPPPRARLAGYWGLTVRSTVRIEEEREHALEVHLAFPERARVTWTPRGARPTTRTIVFRSGEALWRVEPGEAESRALPPAEGETWSRRLLLRQALFLWPHGHAWEGDGGSRRARLEGVEGGLVLRALLEDGLPEDGDERPRSLELVDGSGRVLASITGVAWRAFPDDRVWPGRLTVRGPGGEVVWRETVRAVEPSHLTDAFFRPADRRPPGGAPARRARPVTLSACTVKRVELEPGLGGEAALARAHRIVAEALEERSEVDPAPQLELDAAGRPVAVRLRWAGPGPAPRGWRSVPAREALGLALRGPVAGPADVAVLRRAARREGRRARDLLLGVRPAGEEGGRAQLLLLLGPR